MTKIGFAVRITVNIHGSFSFYPSDVALRTFGKQLSVLLTREKLFSYPAASSFIALFFVYFGFARILFWII